LTSIHFDFHAHTTASDGTLTPSELVNLGKKLSLTALAITDHDSIEGLPEGAMKAEELGIQFLHGVELNTDASGTEIDILGYFKKIKDQSFRDLVNYRKDERVRRAKEMVKKLNKLGIDIRYERVRELAGGIVARPHVAQALIERGYAHSQQDAFDRYIGFGRPAYAERDPLMPEDAIAHIKESGGVAIIAHPGLIGDDSLVHDLLEQGAEGLEAYYAYHTPEQQAKYLALAKEHNVIVGCGSDYHGPNRKKNIMLGSVEAPPQVMEILISQVNERWLSWSTEK
jgi:3',5'-nucleoside bisphosphate phosphatase